METKRRAAEEGIRGWRAEITVRVEYDTVGPLLLPHDEPVTLGRSEQCGLRADHPSVSRTLAVLDPSARGWVLENGKRTRVRATSPFIVEASFAPGAQVLLQPADWTLTWDLDVLTEASIRYRRTSHGEQFPTARDLVPTAADNTDPKQFIGTDVAGHRLQLTDLQRRRLGALFAYQIEGRPKPDQLIQAAAKLSGDSISQINSTWVKVREYVNRHRDIRIESIEDLGYHLVEVAGVIGLEDLPDSRG